MSLRKRLAKIFLLSFLVVGATFGVPMDPKKIGELMNLMNRSEIVRKADQADD